MPEAIPTSPVSQTSPQTSSQTSSQASSQTTPRPDSKQQTQQLPPFNVVLLNDDDHTYSYVIDMLGRLFGYGAERAFQMAKVVDRQGRVIVLTTHKEKAELKRDQIRGFGCDPRIENCTCSMGAIIEPAQAT